MKLVVFGLSVSSAWGNGHATLWRGLIRALAAKGHTVTFYERDTPYYAAHRDCRELPNGQLVLYKNWDEVRSAAVQALREADAGIVTSYCPDAIGAIELVLSSAVPIRVYYDLDTPLTLDKLARGEPVPYIPSYGLRDFDLVLSYTGGSALTELQRVLGARRTAPLYGAVDPQLHTPSPPVERYRADLSYLGTYSQDRQSALTELFLAPAEARPDFAFAVGGSQYPRDFAWKPNVKYLWHVPPHEHAAFYSSARLSLNVTRAPMARLGYCPMGRLFEAASCGAAVISDDWVGIDAFYEPGEELLVAKTRDDVLRALALGHGLLHDMARRARERTLAQHTTSHRAEQLITLLEDAHTPTRAFERETGAALEV
ncbi:MAG: glycosyltransferase [Polyangiales bacterium]